MAEIYNHKIAPFLTKDAETEQRLAIKYNGKGFDECDYDDPGAFARGRADILMISDDTTEAFIYDHKTQKHIEEADTFQMGFYAWVLSKIHPYLEKIHTVLYFAQFGYYSEKTVWTKKELDIIEDQIYTMVSTLEGHSKWDPVPHNGCQYCPFLGECPALEKYISIDENGYRVKKNNLEVLGDNEKAREVAASIHLLEEFLKTAKKNLKDFVNTYGVQVSIPGKTYDTRAKEKINWDKVNKGQKMQVVEAFNRHGVDPVQYMGFSEKSSAPIWVEGSQKLREELSSILPRKIDTDFRGRK